MCRGLAELCMDRKCQTNRDLLAIGNNEKLVLGAQW